MVFTDYKFLFFFFFLNKHDVTNVYDVRSAAEQPSSSLCLQITQFLNHLKTDVLLEIKAFVISSTGVNRDETSE